MPDPISQLVRDLRKRRGWTQRQLADEMGVTEASVRNYEKGRQDPEPLVLLRMSELAPGDLRRQVVAVLPEQLREWHGRAEEGKRRSTRYSEEARQALLEALDIILERAPSAMVQDVTNYLQQRADRYSKLREFEEAPPPVRPQKTPSRHRKTV